MSQISQQQRESIKQHYEGLIEKYWQQTYVLKKEIVNNMKEDLLVLGYPREKIAAKISKDLDGDISDDYVHRLLGDEFKEHKYTRKDLLWKDDPQYDHSESVTERMKSPTTMDKDELRSHIDFLRQKIHNESRQLEIFTEHAKKKNIALLPDELEGGGADLTGSISNKSVTEESGTENLHSGPVSTPKYKITEQDKIFQDIVIRAFKVLRERTDYMIDTFIPSIKINSEEEANRYAQAAMWFADFFKPMCDQKYRLSMIDWMNLIRWNMAQGPSAASKMMKKPIAKIEDLDPESLPKGFNKTILALQIDKKTGEVIFVSPTKEHVDSRINFMLDFLTLFINRIKFVAALAEMQEAEFKKRNFRAAVLSEKLTDCK